MSHIFQDWPTNARSAKARLVLVFLRTSQVIRHAPLPLFAIGIPILIAYRVIDEWMLCIALPWNTRVGSGLRLFHSMGLVVNDQVVIGKNVVLRHTTTIGAKETLTLGSRTAPTIGSDVDIGAHVVILGPITVCNWARIGAGSIVIKDVPAGATVVGNPARIIKMAAGQEVNHA